MAYCPNCGSSVEDGQIGPAAAEMASAEVQIARIQCDRDIEVARINARQDKDWNATRLAETEMETEAAVVAAVAEADVLGDVVAASTAASEPAEPPEIINAPQSDVEVPDDSPPPVETEGSEPPAPERKTIGLGAW
jgi:hypothetical protein